MSCIYFFAVGTSVVPSIMSSIYVLCFTIFAASGYCSLPISAVLRKAIVAMVAEGLSPNETLWADYLNEVYVNPCLGLSCGLDVVSINNG